MKSKIIMIAILAIFSGIIFMRCNPEETPIPNEEELITTLMLTFIPVSGGGDEVQFRFEDPDGDGGIQPVISNPPLMANTVYNGKMELLNETESPELDITEEIQEEARDHQFFFNISSGANMVISYNDQDSEGNPLGLNSDVTCGDVSQGTLTIILRHEPDKNAPGVSDGQIDNAGGETDIEVLFNVSIE